VHVSSVRALRDDGNHHVSRHTFSLALAVLFLNSFRVLLQITGNFSTSLINLSSNTPKAMLSAVYMRLVAMTALPLLQYFNSNIITT